MQTVCRHPNEQKVLDLIGQLLADFPADEPEAKLVLTVIIRNGVPRKVFSSPEHSTAF